MEITKEFVRENKGKRFNVTLDNGTVHKKIGFFLDSSYGSVCYLPSRNKRSGYMLPYYWNIVSVVECKKPQITKEGNAKKILNRMHKNVWGDIRENLERNNFDNDFDNHFTGKLKFRNITKLLTPQEQMELEIAFENKTEFTWRRNSYSNRGRDLSLSTKLCEDGIFRAWFSSEYAGCGNGDYYLLLSPKTAIFYETD